MSMLEISYLLRYLFALLSVIFTGLLLWLAIKELYWDMKNRVLPVPGYALLPEPAAGEEPGTALPLYHTTNLGQAATSDIRISQPGIGRRHAIIYLFDGLWFVRPAGRAHAVSINGVRIAPPTPLEDGDRLMFGDQSFVFVSQKARAAAAGRQPPQPSAVPDFPRALSAGKRTGAWLAFNGLVLLGGLLLVLLTPSQLLELRLMLGIFCLGFLILADLYYALLPIILKNADRVLFLCLYFLAFLGILFQARLTLGDLFAAGADAAPADVTPAILNALATQGGALFLGLVLLPLIAAIVARTRMLEPLSVVCAIITPLLLVLTLLLGSGSASHGASLWINIGGQSIQLTEFAKITYLAVLASFFKNRPARRNQLVFAVWSGMVFFLIMLLPDLGMAMILLPTTLLVFVIMTSEYWTALLIFLSGSSLGLLAYALFPHVQRRLAGWTSLWSEVNDSNRQIVYSLQAIARGGLFGRGVGNGSPGGIPLASSDMIFAIVCEELGLIVGLAIVLTFILLWLRAARIAVTAQDGLTSSLGLGIGTLFFMEAVIVIGGVTGLIPLTGATLPLIAQGGSSLLAKTMLFAILIGLSARRTEVK